MPVFLKIMTALRNLAPPAVDDPAEKQMAWRTLIYFVIIAVVVHQAWVFGAFSQLTWIPTVAYADEVDTKIQAALKPVNDKLVSIENKHDEADEYLKRLVRKDIREEIYQKLTNFCKATDAVVRQRLRGELDDLQDEYKAVAGQPYPEPRCDDL